MVSLIFGIVVFIIMFFYIFVTFLDDTYSFLNSKLKYVVISAGVAISIAVASAISVSLLCVLLSLIKLINC